MKSVWKEVFIFSLFIFTIPIDTVKRLCYNISTILPSTIFVFKVIIWKQPATSAIGNLYPVFYRQY